MAPYTRTVTVAYDCGVGRPRTATWAQVADRLREERSLLLMRSFALDTGIGVLLAMAPDRLDRVLATVLEERAEFYARAAAGDIGVSLRRSVLVAELHEPLADEVEVREAVVGVAVAALAVLVHVVMREPALVPANDVPAIVADGFVHLCQRIFALDVPFGAVPDIVIQDAGDAESQAEMADRFTADPNRVTRCAEAWGRFLGGDELGRVAERVAADIVERALADQATGNRIRHATRPGSPTVAAWAAQRDIGDLSPATPWVAAYAGLFEAATAYLLLPEPIAVGHELSRLIALGAARYLFDVVAAHGEP